MSTSAAEVSTASDLQAPLLQVRSRPTPPHLRMTLMVCMATTSGAASGSWQSPPGMIIWGLSKQASKCTPASTEKQGTDRRVSSSKGICN